MSKISIFLTLLVASILMPVHASNHQHSDKEVMVILTASSLQTQGMAMVLSNAMSAQGAKVNVLLCDKAGDLALESDQSSALKPRDVTPGQMLRGLISEGARVNVCALYLPNSKYTKDDLIEGIGVASPPDMASQMLNPDFRVFTF